MTVSQAQHQDRIKLPEAISGSVVSASGSRKQDIVSVKLHSASQVVVSGNHDRRPSIAISPKKEHTRHGTGATSLSKSKLADVNQQELNIAKQGAHNLPVPTKQVDNYTVSKPEEDRKRMEADYLGSVFGAFLDQRPFFPKPFHKRFTLENSLLFGARVLSLTSQGNVFRCALGTQYPRGQQCITYRNYQDFLLLEEGISSSPSNPTGGRAKSISALPYMADPSSEDPDMTIEGRLRSLDRYMVWLSSRGPEVLDITQVSNFFVPRADDRLVKRVPSRSPFTPSPHPRQLSESPGLEEGEDSKIFSSVMDFAAVIETLRPACKTVLSKLPDCLVHILHAVGAGIVAKCILTLEASHIVLQFIDFSDLEPAVRLRGNESFWEVCTTLVAAAENMLEVLRTVQIPHDRTTVSAWIDVRNAALEIIKLVKSTGVALEASAP